MVTPSVWTHSQQGNPKNPVLQCPIKEQPECRGPKDSALVSVSRAFEGGQIHRVFYSTETHSVTCSHTLTSGHLESSHP